MIKQQRELSKIDSICNMEEEKVPPATNLRRSTRVTTNKYRTGGKSETNKGKGKFY